MSSSPSFSRLPNELLTEILGYLTLLDLALGLWPLRNKRIRSLCQDSAVCKDVFVDKSWDADAVASKVILMAAPNMKSLTFQLRQYNRREKNCCITFDDKSIYPLAVLALENCPKLEYLQCRQWVPEAVLLAIGKSSSLSRLVLEHAVNTCITRNRGHTPSTFVPFTRSFRHLRCLDMEWEWYERDFQKEEEDESWAMAIADGCRSLERLRIPYVRMGEQTFKYVLDHLKETLKDLKVYGVPLTNTAYKHLAQCQLLECFGIYDARHLGAEGLEIIVTVLSSTLKELAISGWVSFKGQDFNQVFGGRVMSDVLVLRLSNSNYLDDSWLQMIVLAFPNLESLDVGFSSKVSDDGVKIVLRECKKLKELSLTETAVTWVAFEDLSSCYNLKSLAVCKNKVVDVATVILKQVPQSPHLRHLKVIKRRNSYEDIVDH